jgi:glycosyltransferase involved in cell wall biosynthesis
MNSHAPSLPVRLAIIMSGGSHSAGGYNYLLNLVKAVAQHVSRQVQPLIFAGTDVTESRLAPFAGVAGVQVITAPALNASGASRSLAMALALGNDPAFIRLLNQHRADLVFETAQFFGWRLGRPALAWITDLQHRHMPELFPRLAYWKREIGFQSQMLSGREIMLSSETARRDCETFYPRSTPKLHVVRFAVPTPARPSEDALRQIVNTYNLPARFFYLPNQFWRHKNHSCVIRALHILKSAGHEIVVAASGPQADPRRPQHFEELRQLVADLDVSHNFRLLGMIPTNHLHALLYTCAALINPSTSEGWSTTVEEAKSTGTPMILSSLPVHQEQAGGGASFFDARDPENLAAVLHRFVPLDTLAREEQIARARVSSYARLEKFARDFAALAVQTAGSPAH